MQPEFTAEQGPREVLQGEDVPTTPWSWTVLVAWVTLANSQEAPEDGLKVTRREERGHIITALRGSQASRENSAEAADPALGVNPEPAALHLPGRLLTCEMERVPPSPGEGDAAETLREDEARVQREQ